MTWGFIWLMFVLKIPILMLLGIVWWAVKQTPEPDEEEMPGDPVRARPHPPQIPRRRRPRGPHGDDAILPAPPRIRTTVVRGRDTRRTP